MKKILAYSLIGFFFTACGDSKNTSTEAMTDLLDRMDSITPINSDTPTAYIDEITAARMEDFKEFSDEESSPLTPEDREKFLGLDYYDIQPSYNVKAAVKIYEQQDTILFATSTDRKPAYLVWGELTFTLKDTLCTLKAYRQVAYLDDPDWGNMLFIPYTDATNGFESYGGGRYLELEMPEEGENTMMIDFNLGFNPYCAYSDRFSCPVPPKDNNLAIAIEAGVKSPPQHH